MRRREDGVVALAATLLLFVLFLFALSANALITTDLVMTARFKDKVQAELLARAGIEKAIGLVKSDTTPYDLLSDRWRSDESLFREQREERGSYTVSYIDGQGKRRYGFVDEESKVNLNTAPLEVLAALLPLNEQQLQAILDYRAKHLFTTPEELFAIEEIPPTIFGTAEAIRQLITVWGSGKINVNTAQEVVLAALPGMTLDALQAFLTFRRGADGIEGTADDGVFQTVDQVASVEKFDAQTFELLSPLLTIISNAFLVNSVGRVENSRGEVQESQIMAVIDRGERLIKIRDWRVRVGR
ncbi:MAG: general secretion pathway protein GspK [Candidatus Tectomicrobia bacterium]|nr:general secretion pathway protein GspK [Candidatus Tectomicrobia bacterium]